MSASGVTELTTIDGDAFKHTPKLYYIDFDGCGVQHVGHDLVTHLDDLGIMKFGFNPCVDREAFNRDEILKLNAELPILCPPVDPSTRPTTEAPPTTGIFSFFKWLLIKF